MNSQDSQKKMAMVEEKLRTALRKVVTEYDLMAKELRDTKRDLSANNKQNSLLQEKLRKTKGRKEEMSILQQQLDQGKAHLAEILGSQNYAIAQLINKGLSVLPIRLAPLLDKAQRLTGIIPWMPNKK